MDMNKDYLSIMKESLNKKLEILDEIIKLNEIQKESVTSEKWNESLFNESIDKKDQCIRELNKLDNGFSTVYDRVKQELSNNKEKYKSDIEELKNLISQITEKSMEVQISEKRNEKMVYDKIASERMKIRKSKNRKNVAQNYYKSMNKVNVIEPQFMDKKK